MNKEKLQSVLEPLNKGLQVRGRSLRVADVRASEATVEMVGFCCTDCDCVAAFKQRAKDLLTSKSEITTVNFV